MPGTEEVKRPTMNKIVAIALNTFKEAVRNRILYILLIFALIFMGFSGVLRDLTIAAEDKIIKDLGIAAINVFGLLIALFVGIGLVYNELDKKTIYTIVSKPIDRWQFILGKYFGLLLTIYVNVIIMTLFFLFILNTQVYLKEDKITEAIWKIVDDKWVPPTALDKLGYVALSFIKSAGKAIGTVLLVYNDPTGLTKNIMSVIGLTCIELAIITSFAVLYSSFSTPTLSAIFTFLTFIIGRLNEDIIRYAWKLKEKNPDMSGLSINIKYYFSLFAAHVSPNLEFFNKRSEMIYNNTVTIAPYSVIYGIIYCFVILALSVMIFRRRNFK